MRILVVDDDRAVRESLRRSLQFNGYQVDLAADGQQALDWLADQRPDAMVLDVMMPRVDGLEVARRLRSTGDDLPILVLTARDAVSDRVAGLDAGADDYLPKPFEPRELVARIQAVLRRRGDAGPGEEEVVRAGGLELDRTRGAARLDGRELALTTAELALLDLLMRNRGRILSRDRILEATRGLDWEAYDRSVDVLVSRLRQKLGDDARRPRLIRTVRGAGYGFIGGGE